MDLLIDESDFDPRSLGGFGELIATVKLKRAGKPRIRVKAKGERY